MSPVSWRSGEVLVRKRISPRSNAGLIEPLRNPGELTAPQEAISEVSYLRTTTTGDSQFVTIPSALYAIMPDASVEAMVRAWSSAWT